MIVESISIKGLAFRELFAAHPERLDRIERFHYDNGGLSRYEKFAWIYRERLRQPLTPEMMSALDLQFGEIVARQMRECPFVRGAREFIEAHGGCRSLFIASGTPERELREIVADRALASSFRGVYGAPRNKSALLQAVADEIGVTPRELVFIGDGRQDFEAACEAGAAFVGRTRPGCESSPTQFPGAAMIVSDLQELLDRWSELEVLPNHTRTAPA